MAKEDFCQKLQRVERTVTIKSLSKTFTLVATNPKRFMEFDAFRDFD